MAFTVINTQKYLTAEARTYLGENGCELRDSWLDRMTEVEFCREVRGVDAVIAGGELWTETVFQAADRLKIVARSGAGTDRVDLEAATRHGVLVTNTPGATSHAVADFTLGLILGLLRNIPAMAQEMRTGKWSPSCGKELGSLTLGVVGAGAIGKQVILRARSFGAKILAYELQPDLEFAGKTQTEYVSLDELMSRSDIVSLHVPLTVETRQLINQERLGRMKKSSYLVNTSRAGVVDKAALVRALQAKEIAGAALDVHDPTPCGPDDPLVVLENVIATPNTAFFTEQAVARMCITAATDVVTVLRGGSPRFLVNRK